LKTQFSTFSTQQLRGCATQRPELRAKFKPKADFTRLLGQMVRNYQFNGLLTTKFHAVLLQTKLIYYHRKNVLTQEKKETKLKADSSWKFHFDSSQALD
jgi:hypothetical protein